MIEKQDYDIVDKNGVQIDSQLEDKMKNLVQEFINHPKFEAYTTKKLYEWLVYGEASYSEDDLDKIYKEITCCYNDGLYCKKGIPGTKCDLGGCVAHTDKNETK